MDSMYQGILNSLNEGVYLIDSGRVVIYWNKGAERITGIRAGDIIGKACNVDALYHYKNENSHVRAAAFPVHRTLLDGKRREANACLRHQNGQTVEVSVKTVPLCDGGKVVGAAEVFSEFVEQKAVKAAGLSEDGMLYDALTGLPSRRYVDFYLKNRLSELENLGISFSIIMAEIQNLRQINETYGLKAGDRVVQAISREMRGAFRKNDFVGRWGGDQFGVIIIGVSEEDLGFICEKIRNLVKNPVLRVEGESVSVNLSIRSTLAFKGDTPSSLEARLALAG